MMVFINPDLALSPTNGEQKHGEGVSLYVNELLLENLISAIPFKFSPRPQTAVPSIGLQVPLRRNLQLHTNLKITLKG